jgi:dihydrodipicolinate synthase/N-acetylneuraminate lyase
MNLRTPSMYVTSLTAFTPDGALDEDGMRQHFERFSAAGIGAYVGGSGSGEGYALNRAEQRRVMEIAKKSLQGKVQVRAMGVEPRTPREMVEFAQLVEEVGLDGMQIYSLEVGHDGAPSAGELRDYLSEVLESVSIACIPSIHQSVGYVYPVEVVADLVARYPQIVGLNVTTDAHYLSRIIEAVGDRVEIHCGGPQAVMTTLALGGTGCVCSEANLVPELCVSLTDHYGAGRYADAEAVYRRIMGLWPIALKYRGGRGTKAALALLGLPGGTTRRPRAPLGEAEIADVAESLAALDVRSLLSMPPARS